MPTNNIPSLLPLLELLEQPAFFIDASGSVTGNILAEALAPASGELLEAWLGHGAELYHDWAGKGVLVLNLTLLGSPYRVSVRALDGGRLFLLSPEAAGQTGALQVTARVLRQPLTELSNLAQQLGDLAATDKTGLPWRDALASVNRSIYRLSRISANMADLERLQTGTALHTSSLELQAFLTELGEELQALCQEAGHPLEWKLPNRCVTVSADPILLERAINNLISNALKFSDAGTPILFKCDVTSRTVFFRVRNQCTDPCGQVLHDAFQRLNRQGALPDPNWGVGLGLPLVCAIARLHGGTAAVEQDASGVVTVTVSIRRQSGALHVESPPFDYTGGMRRSLVELSDSLPTRCFDPEGL